MTNNDDTIIISSNNDDSQEAEDIDMTGLDDDEFDSGSHDGTNINDYNPLKTIVKVFIGSTCKYYDVERLKQLSYFDALLSSRWQQRMNSIASGIVIFENSSNINTGNNNSNNQDEKKNSDAEQLQQSINNSGSINNFPFQLEHIDYLLQTIESRSIPLCMPCSGSMLDQLINCYQFMMNKECIVINSDIIATYLKRIQPPLFMKDLQLLLKSVNSKIAINGIGLALSASANVGYRKQGKQKQLKRNKTAANVFGDHDLPGGKRQKK